jgi:hypothetical protein
MAPPVSFRITILNVDSEVWCDVCGVPSAFTVTYVLEPAAEEVSDSLRVITYCEACEPSR